MKTLLLFANDDDGFAARLEAAIDLTRLYEGHLTCIQVTPYDAFIFGDPFGGVYALPTVVEEIQRTEESHRGRVEERLAREGISWDWLQYDGQPAQLIVDRSRLADLVVLSLAPRDGRTRSTPLSVTADVTVHARSPILAVPHAAKVTDWLGPAVVAWNGSVEASHALRFSLPMLKTASAVHIVTICDDDTEFPSTDASQYLARHGISSQLHEWPRQGRPVPDAIRDAARTLEVSYVVMGAYGHSRIREAILGGTTRSMLDSSEVPVLFGH